MISSAQNQTKDLITFPVIAETSLNLLFLRFLKWKIRSQIEPSTNGEGLEVKGRIANILRMSLCNKAKARWHITLPGQFQRFALPNYKRFPCWVRASRMVKMDLFPCKERWRISAWIPWRYLTAVLYKGFIQREDGFGCLQKCVWEAERQWAQAERRKVQAEHNENLFPNEKDKTMVLPTQRNYISLMFSIPEWTSPEQPGLSSYLTLLEQEIGQETSWGLFHTELSCGSMILWCQPSHTDIRNNMKFIKHLKTEIDTSILHIMYRLV